MHHQPPGGGLHPAVREAEPFEPAQDEEGGDGVDIRQDQGKVISGDGADRPPRGEDHGEWRFPADRDRTCSYKTFPSRMAWQITWLGTLSHLAISSGA